MTTTWISITEVSRNLGVKRNTVLRAVLRASGRGESWVKKEVRQGRGRVWMIDTSSSQYRARAAKWRSRAADRSEARTESLADVKLLEWSESGANGMPSGLFLGFYGAGASRRPVFFNPWDTAVPTPQTELQGRQLVVRTPTVEMRCRLPLGCAWQEYDCQVDFLRLPLHCELEACDILSEVQVGIGTMVSEQTRPYLRQHDQQRWEVRLGRITVTLTTSEAREVCACLDVVGTHYAEAVRSATTALELWDYPIASLYDITGVELCLVPQATWHLMRRFASEFAMDRGESIWHCFESQPRGEEIAIGRPGAPRHAGLWPLAPESDGPHQYIPLLYEYPDRALLTGPASSPFQWSPQVGPGAIWTASYTDQWLRTVLVPHVLAHYQANEVGASGLRYRVAQALAPAAFALSSERESLLLPARSCKSRRYTPFDQLYTTRQLLRYAWAVQHWLERYPVPRMLSAPLRPYYAAISAFAGRASTRLGLLAAAGYLVNQRAEREGGGTTDAWRWLSSSTIGVGTSIADHVRQVERDPYEYTSCALIMTQVLLLLLLSESDRCGYVLISQLRKGFQALWEQIRFDERYMLG